MFYQLSRHLYRDMFRNRHYLSFLGPYPTLRHRGRLQVTVQTVGVFFLRSVHYAFTQSYSRFS